MSSNSVRVRASSSLFLALLALPFVASPACAQGLNGFLAAPGHATIAISHTFESYDEYWEASTIVSDPSLGKVETGSVSFWIDMGLYENLSLVAAMAYVDAASDGPAPLSAQGLQDHMLMLRYRFLSFTGAGFRHGVVAGAGYRGPLAAYNPNLIIAIGDATNDGLFRLIYQIEADYLDGMYLAAELGYDLRNEDAPDGTSIFGELGATVGRASASVAMVRTWADGGFDLSDPVFSFQGLGGEMFRVGGKLYYRVAPTFGIALSGFTTLDGRNIGDATGTSTSFVVQL